MEEAQDRAQTEMEALGGDAQAVGAKPFSHLGTTAYVDVAGDAEYVLPGGKSTWLVPDPMCCFFIKKNRLSISITPLY
jgi:hypothetical protein